MPRTLDATRPTHHGASRLVQAMCPWSVKTRRAPSRHCADRRTYSHHEHIPPGQSNTPPSTKKLHAGHGRGTIQYSSPFPRTVAHILVSFNVIRYIYTWSVVVCSSTLFVRVPTSVYSSSTTLFVTRYVPGPCNCSSRCTFTSFTLGSKKMRQVLLASQTTTRV